MDLIAILKEIGYRDNDIKTFIDKQLIVEKHEFFYIDDNKLGNKLVFECLAYKPHLAKEIIMSLSNEVSQAYYMMLYYLFYNEINISKEYYYKLKYLDKSHEYERQCRFFGYLLNFEETTSLEDFLSPEILDNRLIVKQLSLLEHYLYIRQYEMARMAVKVGDKIINKPELTVLETILSSLKSRTINYFYQKEKSNDPNYIAWVNQLEREILFAFDMGIYHQGIKKLEQLCNLIIDDCPRAVSNIVEFQNWQEKFINDTNLTPGRDSRTICGDIDSVIWELFIKGDFNRIKEICREQLNREKALDIKLEVYDALNDLVLWRATNNIINLKIKSIMTPKNIIPDKLCSIDDFVIKNISKNDYLCDGVSYVINPNISLEEHIDLIKKDPNIQHQISNLLYLMYYYQENLYFLEVEEIKNHLSKYQGDKQILIKS